MSYPTHLADDRDRPHHPRLTSSAYLLGAQHARRDADNDDGSGGGGGSYRSSLGLGRPKSFADAQEGEVGGIGPGGTGGEGEPMVGHEAMRLGTSFFLFGMLIGESLRFGSVNVFHREGGMAEMIRS